jgi:hypothetical protein
MVSWCNLVQNDPNRAGIFALVRGDLGPGPPFDCTERHRGVFTVDATVAPSP